MLLFIKRVNNDNNQIKNILGTTIFAIIDQLAAQCLPSCIHVDSCLESIFLSQLINKSLLLLTKVSSTQLRFDTVTDCSFAEPPLLSVYSLAFPFFRSFIYPFLHSLSKSPSHAISAPLWDSWPSSFPLWNSFHTHTVASLECEWSCCERSFSATRQS